MNLITLTSYNQALDAHFLKSKLEDSGIQCVLLDEHVASLNFYYSGPVGGVKVKVDISDYDEAIEVLNEFEQAAKHSEDVKGMMCPKCASTSFTYIQNNFNNQKGLFSIIISLIFFIKPSHYNEIYKCNDCDYKISRTN